MFLGLLRYTFAKARTLQPVARVAVFNAKKYDQKYFAKMMAKYPPNQQIEFNYFSEQLAERTA